MDFDAAAPREHVDHQQLGERILQRLERGAVWKRGAIEPDRAAGERWVEAGETIRRRSERGRNEAEHVTAAVPVHPPDTGRVEQFFSGGRSQMTGALHADR